MGPLTSQNCPLTSQFFVQYCRDFLTVRIDPVKYKFLCMPEFCSDPSVCTQETAALQKIYRASHLRCAPGYRCNDINCLITGNPNSIVVCVYFVRKPIGRVHTPKRVNESPVKSDSNGDYRWSKVVAANWDPPATPVLPNVFVDAKL